MIPSRLVAMFVTTPGLEYPIPAPLREPGGRYWKAFKLTTEAPWFLITFSMRAEAEAMAQTMAVGWETTLLGFVKVIGAKRILAIKRMGIDSENPGDWSIKDVAELWRPSKEVAGHVGPVVFRFKGETAMRNAFLDEVELDISARELLFCLAA